MAMSLVDQFRAAMDALEAETGGNASAAARLAGQSIALWRAWRRGAQPSLPRAEAVIKAAQALDRAPPSSM